jgi:hypothetical protein
VTQSGPSVLPAISTLISNTPLNEAQGSPRAITDISLDNTQHLISENASLRDIADVFEQYICGAVRRDKVESGGTTYWVAAVTMDFPHQGLVDCLMSVAIQQNKVEFLAMALFKVHVESVGEVRYVVLNGGVKLLPNPEITLKGVLDEAIISVFGPKIYEAITASRMRKMEREEGTHVTECVSMMLTSNPVEGAIINLSLDVKEGAQIQNKLYT